MKNLLLCWQCQLIQTKKIFYAIYADVSEQGRTIQTHPFAAGTFAAVFGFDRAKSTVYTIHL